MIPQLAALAGVDRIYRDFLDALPVAGFTGDIHPDAATRLVTATDNSVYQILPQAVVYPRGTNDVAAFCRVVSEPRFADITFSPRGGGTGTNGQSLSDGVIVDTSRHMNHVLEVDLEGGWVRVQPGVVLDQLNAQLKRHGVFFAPNLSPSSRATLGGMISTDASGKGSRIYGRTSEHVLQLTSVFSGGEVWTSQAMSSDELEAVKGRDDFIGHVHRVVDGVITEHAALIEQVFPRLKRFMTGYNLAKIRDSDGRFDLCQLLCGSEGTLGILTEARLRLTPIPTHSRLVVLKYATFEDALGSAEQVVATDPGAIETIDETVLGLARQDVIWHAVGPILDPGGTEADRVAAINLVEYEGNDAAAVEAKVAALLADASRGAGRPYQPIGFVVAGDAAETEALWSLRKKGVGLLGNAPGARQPIAFVEDTVVPPERLRDYIREFRAVLDEAGVCYGMFGHIDVGCLHVRPALDMTDPADERLLRTISDRVVEIVQRYGGVVWGEHGKGMRSEYNPVFFGEALYTELCRIKAAFDPTGRMNPGKLAVPLGGPEKNALQSIDAPKRGAQDRQIPAVVRARWPEALRCNGNGQCFDWDPDHVMCPSSKVTRDRIHSPKGRAGVMREWLRQLSVEGVDPRVELEKDDVGWRGRSGYDFSHEVYDAMDGCLACKACATRCPIKVDVPRMRSDFLALYHQRYRRPLVDFFVAGLESVVPVLGAAPRLSNALAYNPMSRWLLQKIVGIVDPPRFSVPSAAAGLKARQIPRFDMDRIRALSPEDHKQTVLIMPDAFTQFHEAEVLLGAVDLLRGLGFSPEVLPFLKSGKGFHVKGFMKHFARTATQTTERLETIAELGCPIVGLDPAVVLVFRDEVPHMLLREPRVRVHLLQEWLATAPFEHRATPQRFELFGHCTERTFEPGSMTLWQTVFARLGLELDVASVGCCGMCGAFGHERRHVEESRGVFDMSWGKRLPQQAEARRAVLATGHSCRSQVKRFGGFRPPHPVEVLARALTP